MVSLYTKIGSVTGVFLITLSLVLFSTSIGFRLPKGKSKRPSPIILVPGNGGSQLQAKLNKTTARNIFCEKFTDSYFDIWLNKEIMIPSALDCWVDNMRLVYNNVTRKTSNSPGVKIRVPGFGNTSTVEYLDNNIFTPKSISAYFADIVKSFVAEGYIRRLDIRAAPYDYRKAPNELDDFYKSLKKLTEDTFNKTGNRPVTFICHSMGCPTTLYFLNHQAQKWKDKYVKSMVSLGGAWAGAVKAMKAIASGENLGIYVINHLKLREEQRTDPSLAYMVPSDLLWRKDEILVTTEKRNYTIADLYDFYQDIGYPIGYEMWKDTRNLTHDLEPPNVPVHCLHGVNVSTIERLVYGHDEFPDSNPTLVLGDGDGTVNLRSLESCRLWKNKQSQKVVHVPLKLVDHMGILSDPGVLDYIKKVVSVK